LVETFLKYYFAPSGDAVFPGAARHTVPEAERVGGQERIAVEAHLQKCPSTAMRSAQDEKFQLLQ